MADYHPLIARAVAGLEKNTGDGRRALYERARSALIAQLRSTEPALSESEITRERLALEEAIRKVEAEAARQNRLEARAEPKPKMRPPDAAKWEELARPPGGAAPVPPPPPASLPRRSESAASSASAPAPDLPPRRPRPQPPAPAASADQRHSNTIFDEPLAAEPPSNREPSFAAPAPAPVATRTQPRPRPPSPDRRAPAEPGQASLRSITAEAAELGSAPARAARSAREANAAIAPVEEAPPQQAEQPADAHNEHMPEMLESSFTAEDSRPRPARGRAVPAADRDEIVTRPARSYRDLIKVGVALVLLAGFIGVVASQWSNMVDFYRSVRAPAVEVAKEPAAPTTNTTPKIAERFVPGRQQAVVTPPASGAPAAPQAAVAQRVVLYEEDPNDPAGKQFVGSAVWRTEVVSPAPKASPELAIRADIDVPERRLAVTWVLRRNTDQVLPASHTIEITFKLPPDFPSGGISNVPGILMKPAEQTRGIPLAGSAAKVTNGYFLIGLSAMETERERNIQMLKERAWLDIPLVYNNGRRAILAVEKGTAGERAFEQAFAAWATATSTAK
jgi:hypothetical protein